MFRILTIEREYGCGGGAIASELAARLGWTLWDHRVTEEIAGMAKVDCSAVERHGERVDSPFYRLAKVFWRGSYERAMPLDDTQTFDADCMVAMMERIAAKIAREGNAVAVDRERIAFIKHYFGADWPTRALYHMMINTMVGNEDVIATILDAMRRVETRSGAQV